MYNVISPRKYTDANGVEKTSFVTIGIAFPMKEKDGMRIQLNALPITDTLLIMPRTKKGGGDEDESI
jgi:hypothetical protein